jgi:hypothetical protein
MAAVLSGDKSKRFGRSARVAVVGSKRSVVCSKVTVAAARN